MQKFLALLICVASFLSVPAQDADVVGSATTFINALTAEQKKKAVFPFDTEERYNFHFVPRNDWKGISINEMDTAQRAALFTLLKASLSAEGYSRVQSIISFEILLKQIEKRAADDHYRDPGNYYLSIFGMPSEKGIWGWRFQGHHLSFTFAADQNTIVSGTPGFIGSNPGVVLDGPQKGLVVLKDETDKAYLLVNSLTRDQLRKAIFDTAALPEIITLDNRKAIINDSRGILYTELTMRQQHLMLDLLSVYIHRYTKLFADEMMRDIHDAGLNNLRFAWAGSTKQGPGHPNYYRLIGPSIIIEFDNTQGNGNHFHTVVRDLKNDFGGDELLEHYRKSHGAAQ